MIIEIAKKNPVSILKNIVYIDKKKWCFYS